MKKIILAIILLLPALIGICVWWIYLDMNHQLQQPLNIKSPEILVVEPGMSLTTVSKHIYAKGWISHPYYLIFEGRRQAVAGSIKTGEYLITTGTTPLSLLEQLVSGKVIQYSLTLLEGWTFEQCMQAIQSSNLLIHTLVSYKPAFIMDAIGYAGHFAEGRFFPDTYYFPRGTTDVEFLRRAYATMQQVLTEEWAHRSSGLPYTSPYDALIMASIIEKETAIAEEYDKIAGVFVRRLQKGIKLQTDPTVIYALGDSFNGNIQKKDLSYDSPYNTYVYQGLPPTPIAIPGRAAIRAAMQPDAGESLYFVAKGDGSHHFSNTLQEHNRAVTRYQLTKRK